MFHVLFKALKCFLSLIQNDLSSAVTNIDAFEILGTCPEMTLAVERGVIDIFSFDFPDLNFLKQ